ncbi:hypothetical protein BGZ95_010090 [Linnemannia exigua]|uniref:TFIIB-type domain-containing protein n=1 Tax=Linnemannia exigua TaxID=604196 RepID=A0AAD4DKB6_9FUNG|nr:hypothetical protein BGZ95_010090 [Linnemannia exigua]
MGTPINTSATSTPPSTSTPSPSSSAWRSRRQCTSCGGYRIADDHETASAVCMDCGLVADENMLEDKSGLQGYGLTRVTAIGREYPNKKPSAREKRVRVAMGNTSNTSLQNTPGAEARFYSRAYLQQVEESRSLIISAARTNGLSDGNVKRAIFLFLLIKKKMPATFVGNVKALACLYIAARETGKGLRLLDLAAQSGLSPFKFGAEYKKVRNFLAERKTIDTSAGAYVIEEDPWTELERFLTIGNSEAIERGDFEDIPQDVKDALGINMEPAERSGRLRGLLSMAQKCMIVAMDSSLDDSRRIQPLVGACLVIALDIRLQLVHPSHELLHWVGGMYNAPASTIKSRYRELRKCLLEWARRLPFVDESVHITDKKLIYYAEDVIKYFGHLQEKNRQLWALLDKTVEEDEGEGDADHAEEIGGDSGDYAGDTGGGDDEDSVDQESYYHQGQEEHSDVDAQSSAFHDNSLPLTSEDIRSSMSARRHPPPGYVAKVQRQQRLGELIQEAKRSIANPTVSTLHLHIRDTRRFAWIRRLLVLGMRTEQDIIEASDNCLADWVLSDEAHQTRAKNSRPREDLDSIELTEKDMDDSELEGYLRSKPDQGVVERVRRIAYLEVEEAAKLAVTQRPSRDTSKKVELERKRNRKALSPDEDDPAGGGGGRERSRKLRLEALSDSDDQLETERKNLPRPGQRIIHQTHESAIYKETEGQEDEVYGDVIVDEAEDETGRDYVGYSSDVIDYNFDEDDGDAQEYDYGSE